MKKTLLLLSSLLLSITATLASTSVSGGIYSNTTWTTAGSPYIITGTIVVFPGVTLTIQPGVTVEFNNGIMLEIRQAQLIALGNASDSIIFKSSSSTPSPGIYLGIYLDGGTMSSQFSYCSFDYADTAINSSTSGSLTIKNSNFRYADIGVNTSNASASDTLTSENSNFSSNNTGIYSNNSLTAIIGSCNFYNNTNTGLNLYTCQSFILNNCNFSNNGTGLNDNPSGVVFNKCTNCVFTYNQTGLSTSSTRLTNCYIAHNKTGATSSQGENRYKNSIIDSNTVTGIYDNWDSIIYCRINYNGIGILTRSMDIGYDTLEHNSIADIKGTVDGWGSIFGNVIEYSPVGIIDSVNSYFKITNNSIENNSIGIELYDTTGTLYGSGDSNSEISCNNICNNSTYNLKYELKYNANATNNYWCLTDSASIRKTIYDGYTNISLGLIIITPFDTVPCDSTGFLTSINNIKANTEAFQVYPNPANTVVFISTNQTIDGTITLTNVLGQDVYNAAISGNSGAIQKVDISNLQPGVYFLKITSNGQVLTKKVLKI